MNHGHPTSVVLAFLTCRYEWLECWARKELRQYPNFFFFSPNESESLGVCVLVVPSIDSSSRKARIYKWITRTCGERERGILKEKKEIGGEKTQTAAGHKRHRAAEERQNPAIGGEVCATTLSTVIR